MLLTTAFLYSGISAPSASLIFTQGNSIHLQDFAYHLTLVKSYWSSSGPFNIYDPAAQMDSLGSFLGGEVAASMPVGTSPIILYLWYPLIFLNNYQAYVVWNIFQFTALATPFLIAMHKEKRGDVSTQLTLVLLMTVVLFSPAAYLTAKLGQTAAFAVGLLALTAILPRKGFSTGIALTIIAASLWIKPTYGLAGVGLLIWRRDWKILAASLILIASIGAASHFGLGEDGLRSYYTTLENYQTGEFPAVHREAVSYDRAATFRHILSTIFPESVAAFLALWIFRAALVLSLTLGGLFPLASIMVFAPYLGAYEELLLAVIPFVLYAGAKSWGRLPVLLGTSLLVMILGLEFFYDDLLVTWLLKLILCAYGAGLLLQCGSPAGSSLKDPNPG